jgi:hypothetical protein
MAIPKRASAKANFACVLSCRVRDYSIYTYDCQGERNGGQHTLRIGLQI